jgi:hypothetical protein
VGGVKVSLLGQQVQSCDPDPGSTTTKPNGGFCLFTPSQTGASLTLITEDQDYYAPQAHPFKLEQRAVPLVLGITLGNAVLELAEDEQEIPIQLGAPASHSELYTVRLDVERTDDGGPRRLWSGTAPLSAQRSARLHVPTSALRGPGQAILTASLSGAPSAEQTSLTVDLVGDVRLEWAETPPREVVPQDGFELVVAATSNGVPVTEGGLEVLVNSQHLLHHPLTSHPTRIPVAFSAPRQAEALLEVRYQPMRRQFRETEPLSSEFSLRSPSPLRQLPWIALALAVAYWVMRTWRRPARTREQPADGAAVTPKAGIRSVPEPSRQGGWGGRVIDAHTGQAVVNAEVRIEQPTMTELRCLARAYSDGAGRFWLPEIATLPTTARWVVDAPTHSSLTSPVPTMGSMEIGLVSRRRSLLEFLFKWSRGMGPPWWTGTPRTPTEVAAVAEGTEQEEVRRWALDVQDAAYGVRPPDAQTEQMLVKSAPPLDRSVPHRR